MKQARPIIWGVAIVALGVIFGGNAIGLFNFNVFFDGWWTLFIIIPCINGLITRPEKLGYAIGLVFGVLLLLAAQGIITYDFIVTLIIPAIAIGFGIKLIVTSAKIH